VNLPDGLLYTREHEWVAMKEKVATMGITDFAQGELGDIVFIELPAVGKTVEAGKAFGTIEAVKTVADIFAPISGKIVEVNPALAENPETVNRSPYEEGWMVRIEASKPDEAGALLSRDDYARIVEGGAHA
jgi:glycine cleavage system H protein